MSKAGMQRAAIIIKEPHQQYEGLRTSIGLLLEGMMVQMFVFHHEIENMDEAYRDNMAFLDEIGGQRFSNNSENAEKYDFTHVTIAQAAKKIQQADIVIPF